MMSGIGIEKSKEEASLRGEWQICSDSEMLIGDLSTILEAAEHVLQSLARG